MWSNANGVTRALPISVLDGRYLTQADIAALAASATVETFVSGAGFTPGVTLSLTLANSYLSKSNIEVFFDSAFQGPEQYTLVGQSLAFISPIPVGVQSVYIRGGATRVTGAPSDGTVTDAKVADGSKLSNRISTVNVLDFGADPLGVIDSTAAFQAAVNKGRQVIVPAGTYVMGQITIPSNTAVLGEGVSSIVKPVPGFSGSSWWVTSGSNIEIGGLQMIALVATFPGVIPIFGNPGDRNYVHDIYMPEGGSIGIYTSNWTHSTAARVTVMKAVNVGILFDGSSGSTNTIRDCHVETTGSTAIVMQFGTRHQMHDCVSVNAGGFGITMQFVTHGQMYSNRVHNSVKEGITYGGDGASDGDVYGNVLTWDAGVSQDFGMSLGANGSGGIFRIRYRGNRIVGCGKSGIAFAADATSGWSVIQCEASDNIIIDSNQLGLGPVNGGGAGVILYGATCSGNIVRNNTVEDTGGGKLNYGIFETQIGAGGFPQNNVFFQNKIEGQSSVRVQKTGHSAEAYCQDPIVGYLSWTPTVGAGTGTLTAVSTLAAYYREKNSEVEFYAEFQITNNGTAGQTFTFTLPFSAAFGMGYGRENVLTGSGLVVSIVGNVATVRTVANAYPGGTNAVIEVAGSFTRTF